MHCNHYYLHFVVYCRPSSLLVCAILPGPQLVSSIYCQQRFADRQSIGFLTLRLPGRGLHSRVRFPHRLSVLQHIWRAHYHFSNKKRKYKLILKQICHGVLRQIQSNTEIHSARWFFVRNGIIPKIKKHSSKQKRQKKNKNLVTSGLIFACF